jgi:hypothetical protein
MLHSNLEKSEHFLNLIFRCRFAEKLAERYFKTVSKLKKEPKNENELSQ